MERVAARLAAHTPVTVGDDDVIWAAVALVLASGPDSLLLIRRAERAGDPWSGQAGLPGGRHDPIDRDLLATAARETSEEVGLALEPGACIGVLDDVAPRTRLLPPIAVRPFVFTVSSRPPLALNPEIAAARWVPLDRLRNPSAIRPYSITLRGELRTFPAYHVDDLVVWGMTERILSGFFQVIDG